MTYGHVRVDVGRSGGFAGIGRSGSADTTQLEAENSTTLRHLVDEFIAEETGSSRRRMARRGADRFHYDVTIVRDGDRTSFILDEQNLRPAEQRIIDWVLQRG
jgi:hypothetical protein